MREIKFRGKRVDNGEWVYGYICHNSSYGEEDGFMIYEPDGGICLVAPETIGQLWRVWNNIELYDGDIVMIGLHKRLIRYDSQNERFAFCNVAELVNDNWQDINQAPIKNWWVAYAGNITKLGNIHENPELLKA